jgi:hypothetical protein
MLGAGSFVVYTIFFNRPEISQAEIEAGLVPIKLIQTKNGVDKEVNFTEIAVNIISNSVGSEDKKLRDEIKQGIENAQIDKILFPVLPINKLNIIYSSSNPQFAIEKYLQEVYNIFRSNNIQPNIVQLEKEALNQKTDTILSLIQTNTVLYKSLFYINVPSEVLDLHTNYIKVAQIQNSFLVNLLYATQDPIKLQINSTITIRLLEELNSSIKDKLSILQQNYGLTLQK